MPKINKTIIDDIIKHSKADAPIEACGYLLGKEGSITLSLPMTNLDKSGEHFTFVPEEQFQALKKSRELGLKLVGVYHSHPESPARPSDEDKRLLVDPTYVYIIASLAEAEPVVRAFSIVKGQSALLPLEVI